jgi:N-methylhydantoinase A
MIASVIAELRAEGFTGEPRLTRSISMRYWGQNYEQDVPLPEGDITPELLQRAFETFHRLHEQFYGYHISGETIELIRFNVEAAGETPVPSLPPLAVNGRAIDAGQTTRLVFFQGQGLVPCPVVRRDHLPAGFEAIGPMIIEEVVSTTLVHPGQRVRVHDTGVLTIAV